MKKSILRGVYVVVDASMESAKALSQLAKIKNEKIAAIQIWESANAKRVDNQLIGDIIEMYKDSSTPILINNHWELLKLYDLDGVHFDKIPDDFEAVEAQISRPFIKGLTLQNDLSCMTTFNEKGFDYLSFCSLFPSSSAVKCEIVKRETVEECRRLTSKPIFLAGGISLENLESVKTLPADGVAVVTSIMNAEDPAEKLKAFNNYFNI